MTRDKTIAALKTLETDLRRQGLGALYLYGSVARDSAGSSSDVDLYFDRAPGARIGLSLLAMKHDIEALLGVPVDFGSREGLHPLVRSDIEAGSVRVF
jgi:predicted nucleotidyltransferase